MLSEVGMPSTALQKGFVHTANLLRLKAEEEIIKDSPVPPYFGHPPPPTPSGFCSPVTLACSNHILHPHLCSSSRTPELSWEVPLLSDFSLLTS